MFNIDEVISKFDDSSDNTNLYVFDYYPYQISNNEKYLQIECCYRKRLKSIFMKKYISPESYLYKFLLYMWLYSDLKIFLFNDGTIRKDIFCQLHIKNRLHFNNFEIIRSEKDLRFIAKMLIREYMDAYMVFEDLFDLGNVFMYINGPFPLIYLNDIDIKNRIEKIASHCGLFLRKY